MTVSISHESILENRLKTKERNLTLCEDHYRENFTRENYEKMLSAYHQFAAARDRFAAATQ